MASRIGVLRMQVWRTLHEFLYPYHDQMVHPEPGDHAQRMDLCQWMTTHPELSSVILFTDEASFTRDGINNSRNMHTWSNENPHETRVTNKEIFRDIATVIDLGYSDHKAQVLQLTVKKVLQRGKAIISRQYSERRVEEFKYMLSKESWQEVYLTSDVNSALQIFRNNFDYYFNTAFPYKLQKFRNTQGNNWITRGLKNSGKRMRFLN
jgi:hypothetical protein